MSVIYLVLPIAVTLGAGAVWLFVRCVRTGQYDDLDTPSMRILGDDERAR